MSRLFYHTMQDNLGNLLFDVSGTMRLAGTGTLATIYGDEALTVILPNPMTNHPSYGSFKCFLGAGDYDFYMAKAGYTFETLTGVQGHGTLAQQNAHDVTITGGSIALTETLEVGGQTALYQSLGVGGLAPVGSGHVQVAGTVGLGGKLVDTSITLGILHTKASRFGLIFSAAGADVGNQGVVFQNVAGTFVGTIDYNATVTSYNTTSDARLKTAVEPLSGALDVVRSLNPVSFLWKADGSRGRGLLAQEVAEVAPGVVSGDEAHGEVLGIDYSKLVPYLIGAVKELTQQVEMLQAQVAEAGA